VRGRLWEEGCGRKVVGGRGKAAQCGIRIRLPRDAALCTVECGYVCRGMRLCVPRNAAVCAVECGRVCRGMRLCVPRDAVCSAAGG
jgi:hypothetical protein